MGKAEELVHVEEFFPGERDGEGARRIVDFNPGLLGVFAMDAAHHADHVVELGSVHRYVAGAVITAQTAAFPHESQ